MHDEFAIQQVINRYSQNASRGNWSEVLDTFHPDAVWEIPHLGLRFAGHAELRGALEAFIAQMDYVLQLNSPALIDVSGDKATARSSIREAGKTKGKDEGFEYLGTYADTLVRTDAGWKFMTRVFDGIGAHYVPLSLEPR